MNILILGSGGREHTLAWKILQSPRCKKLFISPGNGGTEKIATNLKIDINDFKAVREIIINNKIEMIVIGPEEPLVNGLTDYLKDESMFSDLIIIGPDKYGALLEGSKSYSKEFLKKYNIPTADYFTVDNKNISEGYKFLDKMKKPYVLKANGLAAGKGVLIINDLEEAKIQLKEMIFNSKFGEASRKVVIEEFLSGIELSCFVLTDGKSFKILPMAKDYKRIGEGDTGLNTGGMGAVSPVPFVDNKFLNKIKNKIIFPTLSGLKEEKVVYRGFIFIGLIKVKEEPFVIEYNVRMGDPETEVVFPRIKGDIVEIFEAIYNQKLDKVNFDIDKRHAATIMLVSGGYPETYKKGFEIEISDDIDKSIIFHAGTKISNSGNLVTSGGRVISVTSLADTYNEAIKRSYQTIKKIKFEKMYFRKDIGFDL